MADKIKNFFKRKKVEVKFRRAGPGYKLTDSTSCQSVASNEKVTPAAPRAPLSEEARQAAAAAMSRIDGHKRHDQAAFNTSLAAIQAQVRRELEHEKAEASKTSLSECSSSGAPVVELEANPHLATQGVFFRCPLVGPDILTKDEWKSKIKEFLYENLEQENGLTAVLLIHTCNKNSEKVSACVETLCKYLLNVIGNPNEEKFKRIRLSNKVFQEKVAPIEGSMEFLTAAGFEQKKLPIGEMEEEFLVFGEVTADAVENIQVLLDALRTAEPIGLDLDRNVRVLYAAQAQKQMGLPHSFFSLTPDELKREQQLRSESVERSMMLRTKVMREKEELREMRKYRFAVIRVRFPDGLLLQGTFHVHEKLSAVNEFIKENLLDESTVFYLCTVSGRLTEDDEGKSLLELKLVPATVLIFVPDELIESGSSLQDRTYLKPEILALLQPV